MSFVTADCAWITGYSEPASRTRRSRFAIALHRWIGHNISGSMPKIFRVVIWIGIAVLGAFALATIALRRGEQINAMWLVVAAFCTYALGYRFYSKFIAAKVLALDGQRATPAERLDNGRDFVPTNKWVVFGHHFAAIAGPGPLVGPVLAAQFGYLPGTLWILGGAVFGGCVEDFVILLFSVRREGEALTEMAGEGGGQLGGIGADAGSIGKLEARAGGVAGRGHRRAAPGAAPAPTVPFRRPFRGRLCRQGFSVCLYHHRLRCRQRIAFFNFTWHNAKADPP